MNSDKITDTTLDILSQAIDEVHPERTHLATYLVANVLVDHLYDKESFIATALRWGFNNVQVMALIERLRQLGIFFGSI